MASGEHCAAAGGWCGNIFEETIKNFNIALISVEWNVDTTHRVTQICFNMQFRLKKKIVWNELANYFDCFVRFSSKKAIHLENINWLQAGAEFISWDKWIWDKSPLYVFILAAEDDIPLFCSLCCRSNVKELCIGVPMLFKEKFLPPTFSSQRQHLGLEMRAIFNIPFSIIPKWLWIPALTFCFLFHAQSLWSIYFGLVLFFFTFFFPPFFPHFSHKDGFVERASFHFPKVLRGWLADLIHGMLNEHARITVNPYLHTINMRL